MNPLEKLLQRLDKVTRIGPDRYKACCPAHFDKTPSLAIKDVDGRILIHCFSQCETADVLAAIGLTFAELMPEQTGQNFKRDKKPFYASDVLQIIRDEARIVAVFACDMARGVVLNQSNKDRLLLAASRINHGYEVAKNGI